MSRHNNPNAELIRDRQAQRRRKNLRRKWANSPSFVAKHPAPWHWDHGVLYDAYGTELIRESAQARGKAGNPAPNPREYDNTGERRPSSDRSLSSLIYNRYSY